MQNDYKSEVLIMQKLLHILERPYRECEEITTTSENDNTLNIIFTGLGDNEESDFKTPDRFLEPAEKKAV